MLVNDVGEKSMLVYFRQHAALIRILTLTLNINYPNPNYKLPQP